MIKEQITLDEFIGKLNEFLLLDPDAFEAIFTHRVRCNEFVARHETIQVGKTRGGYYRLSIVGLLNGVFGIDENGSGDLCGVYDEQNNLIRIDRVSNVTNLSKDALNE